MKLESDAVGRIEGFSEHEGVYRKLFEHSSEGMCLVNHQGYMELVNPALAKMLDSNPDDLVGDSIYGFLVEEDVPVLRKSLQGCLKGGGMAKPCNVRVLKGVGKTSSLGISAAITEIEGKLVAICTVRDPKAQIEIDQQLRQSQRLSNLGTLATGIGHEFNNLLVGIVGYVSFLKMKPLDDELKRYIDVIEDAAQKATNLSRQLLTFGKPYVKETQVFEVRDLVDPFAGLLKATFPRDISVRTDFCPDKIFLDADLNQLHQVLMNLCLNAKDAIKDGGEVSISVAPVTLDDTCEAYNDECKPGEYIRFSVCDTGAGMDEETRKNAFDPFFTTKKVGEGAGLGLSTVYGIIKGHNGFVDVTSTPGKGSRFDIFLPAAREVNCSLAKSKPAEKREQEPARNGKCERILIVDDEATVTAFLIEYLTFLGYSTYAASNGQEALDIYSEKMNEIGVVITDMVMPEMNGADLIGNLSEIDPDVKIILTSGFDTEHIESDMSSMVVGFIQKPFRISELSAVLEKAFHPRPQI